MYSITLDHCVVDVLKFVYLMANKSIQHKRQAVLIVFIIVGKVVCDNFCMHAVVYM